MINKVTLIGRLGQDPELKYTPGGSPVCSFSLATTEHFKSKNGEKQEKTEWHKIIVWGLLAESCSQYLSKGKLVYIEGKLATRSWEKDGHKFYATEIIANSMKFLEVNKKEESPTKNNDHKMQQEFTCDDIPF